MLRDTRLIPGDTLICTKTFKYLGKQYMYGDIFDVVLPPLKAKQMIRSRHIRVGETPKVKLGETTRKDIEGFQLEEPKEKEISNGAQSVIDEFGLTDEDINLIEGTGKDGKVLKADVEMYLDTING